MNTPVKIVSLLALLVSTAWAAKAPGLDSISALLVALAAYWALEKAEPAATESPSPEEREHDRRLFASYEAVLSEAELAAELDTNLEDCRTTSEFLQHVEEWCRLAGSTRGRFLSARLQSAMENFRGALVRLGKFTAVNFFVPRGAAETSVLSLHPDLRHMHGEYRQMFDERHQELRQIVSDVEAYSRTFRLAVKEELHV